MKSSPNVRQNQVSNWLPTSSTKAARPGLRAEPIAARGLPPRTGALLVPHGFPAGSGVNILQQQQPSQQANTPFLPRAPASFKNINLGHAAEHPFNHILIKIAFQLLKFYVRITWAALIFPPPPSLLKRKFQCSVLTQRMAFSTATDT